MTAGRAAELIAVLRSTQLALDEELAQAIMPLLREEQLATNDILFRQGDDVECLYFVADGRLAIVLDETDALVLEEIGPAGVVGEVAVLVGGKRTATARAAEPTRVLGLGRAELEALFRSHPRLSETMSRAAHERLRRTKVAGHLTALFGKLDAQTLREIEARVEWVQLRAGSELFHQGDSADGAYIVALGRLRVAVDTSAGDGDGGERVIDELGPGQWVGEMALLTHSVRSASVYAVRDTELVWLPQAVFDDLMMKHPAALLETSRSLVSRLQRQMAAGTTRRQRGSTSFAIVPTRGDIDIAAFVGELSRCLARFGTITVLDAARVDAALDKPGIANARQQDTAHLRLNPWLLRQEQEHDFVLFVADPTWTEWTDRVFRHADEIMFVGNGDGSPEASEIETRLAAASTSGRMPRQRLVLLHAPSHSNFTGTAQWLARRKVTTSHHVRRGVRGDYERLARLLTGNGINLVFGGGGSRGYAHIGVVRAFEELGIPIDAVAGTSIGAMVAGGVGLGWNSARLLSDLPPFLKACFSDPTLPYLSLLRGRNALRAAQKVVGDNDLEDLPLPTIVVATNLTRSEQCVLRHGSLAMGVRASCSIPGIFPPVPWHGDLLVDGGLFNNVPIDVLAPIYGGKTVAVDVIPEIELRDDGSSDASMSGWRAAWHKVNPLHRGEAPNIFTLLMRAVTTGSRGLSNAADCALFLRPTVSRWNMVDWGAAKPIADEGYRGTLDAIRTWWTAETAATRAS